MDDSSVPAPMPHRLFLALPVPADVAASLESWTLRELEGVRAVPAANLHVTLMFFGETSAETRETLAGLVRTAAWRTIAVETGALALYGRSALALDLRAVPEDEAELARRLQRPEDPLGRMGLHLPKPGRRGPLAPHVTVARSRATVAPELRAKRFPTTAFELDRLVLYESRLDASGATYRVVAEAA